jgi:hypothetical protein
VVHELFGHVHRNLSVSVPLGVGMAQRVRGDQGQFERDRGVIRPGQVGAMVPIWATQTLNTRLTRSA